MINQTNIRNSDITRPAIPDKMVETDPQAEIRVYFNQLHTRLVIGLTLCLIVPSVVLSTYFHIQFTRTLKQSGQVNLSAISESQRNTLDLFLQERVVNMFNLYNSRDFSLEPDQKAMNDSLRGLQLDSESFTDVGFIDERGIQTGYAGPYPELHGNDYSQETWYRQLMSGEERYYISDIHSGFRNSPHFTIGTRKTINGKTCVIRATLDPRALAMYLQSLSQGNNVESILVNADGNVQIAGNDSNGLPSMDLLPSRETEKTGVMEITHQGRLTLASYAWLKSASWALLVMQPFDVAYATMFKARRILTISLVLIHLALIALIFYTTRKLIHRARVTTERGQTLEHQLIHASKLASLGELATGVAHEINNPLAIITSTTGVIRDMFNPSFRLDPTPENVIEELDIIDEAAFRAKGITRQLLDMGRKYTPHMEPIQINDLIEEILTGVKEREFAVNNIAIIKRFTPDLPKVLADRDRLRQVLLNLVNNAGDAIGKNGKITFCTEISDGRVRVVVKDTGQGISADNLSRIFKPFFTTKGVGKGTGLGLSISLDIVESMGGDLTVQSILGKGSVFTVSLPIHHD